MVLSFLLWFEWPGDHHGVIAGFYKDGKGEVSRKKDMS
jgi:hypothetical protein